MVLGTHIVVGGSIAGIASFDPATAFVVGFASHFVLDAFPHWDYFSSLRSVRKNTGSTNSTDIEVKYSRDFIQDLFVFTLDCVLGFIFLFWGMALSSTLSSFAGILAIVCGSLGTITPDFLQFLYFKVRTPFWGSHLARLQRFHTFMHADDNQAIQKKGVGIFYQATLSLLFILLLVL